MAKRKVAHEPQAARPTLEEIKVQSGKYVIASYRGYASGAISIQAPDAYNVAGLPQGYQPQDLLIEAWQWRVIPAWWLDSGDFAAIYQKMEGLVVKRVDEIPPNEDLQELPKHLDNLDRFTRERKQKAWWIATQPYRPDAALGSPKEAYLRATHDVIMAKNMETTENSPEQDSFLRDDLLPILKAALIYEERLGARPKLLAVLEKRIAEIEGTEVRRYQPRRPPIYS